MSGKRFFCFNCREVLLPPGCNRKGLTWEKLLGLISCTLGPTPEVYLDVCSMNLLPLDYCHIQNYDILCNRLQMRVLAVSYEQALVALVRIVPVSDMNLDVQTAV